MRKYLTRKLNQLTTNILGGLQDAMQTTLTISTPPSLQQKLKNNCTSPQGHQPLPNSYDISFILKEIETTNKIPQTIKKTCSICNQRYHATTTIKDIETIQEKYCKKEY